MSGILKPGLCTAAAAEKPDIFTFSPGFVVQTVNAAKQRVILTLDVTEHIGADEGEEQHGDGQGAVGQHLPHFGVQERTERGRERERGGFKWGETDNTGIQLLCTRQGQWLQP